MMMKREEKKEEEDWRSSGAACPAASPSHYLVGVVFFFASSACVFGERGPRARRFLARAHAPSFPPVDVLFRFFPQQLATTTSNTT
jgi:hypothetical protein